MRMEGSHRAVAAAAAASRTAATASRLKRLWLWLITPKLIYPNPPIPQERNASGLGWAGDRGEFRPFDR